MTIRTITFDDEQWQVVPKRPTEDMLLRGYDTLMAWDARTGADIGMRDMFLAMLAVAPEPPAQQPPADCQSAFEAWFGFSVGPDMDLQTYVAWQHWQVAWNAAQPPAPQPITDDADPDAIVAPLPVPEVGEERQAMIDQLRDQAIELDMLREALGVPYEPHQSLLERMLEAARGRAGSGAAPEPPAQQPMSRDREVWRAAITLANNICVQESDRYNGDDATQEASATGYCAQRIRDWIAPTDEQFAELLEEAGIGKGESNA